jgi:hypothetical protein
MKLTQHEQDLKQDIQNDVALGFMVVLGSTCDSLVLNNELSSVTRRKIYESLKEYCRFRGYLKK